MKLYGGPTKAMAIAKVALASCCGETSGRLNILATCLFHQLLTPPNPHSFPS